MKEESNEIVDQAKLANDVSEKIRYEFLDKFLVKPLDPVKVKKEFSKPVATKTGKDDNGIEATDYDKVETEVKEVDSDYRRGVVIKIPISYTNTQGDERYSHMSTIKLGDIIVFRDRAGVFFDLVKDSKMVNYYDIVAIEK